MNTVGTFEIELNDGIDFVSFQFDITVIEKTGCDDSCDGCSGPSSLDCDSCANDYFLQNEELCISSCDQGFYEEYSVCNECHISCLSCYGPE